MLKLTLNNPLFWCLKTLNLLKQRYDSKMQLLCMFVNRQNSKLNLVKLVRDSSRHGHFNVSPRLGSRRLESIPIVNV